MVFTAERVRVVVVLAWCVLQAAPGTLKSAPGCLLPPPWLTREQASAVITTTQSRNPDHRGQRPAWGRKKRSAKLKWKLSALLLKHQAACPCSVPPGRIRAHRAVTPRHHKVTRKQHTSPCPEPGGTELLDFTKKRASGDGEPREKSGN